MARHEEQQSSGLRADDMSAGYGRVPIVDGLHFTLPRSALTVFLGPNGSGKSTILKSLAGLLPTQGGKVLLDGRSIATLPARELARRIGVLAQGPSAPEGLTVLELVQQGRYPHRSLFGRWSAADDEACARALALTGMTDMHGCLLDRLSGGQRQRAWIAMTLAQDTDILLLDEPTTYLDLAHQIEILDLLRSLVRERKITVAAVLHDLNQAARYSDHLVLLQEGAIVAQGEPAAVMTEATISRVFGVSTLIITDPVTASPLCIPREKQPLDRAIRTAGG